MLDIIIPTYKNKEGLQKTLQSINKNLLSDITVTIIDDYSEMYYNDIFEEFPFIQIYYQKENQGPGNARQLGISVTKEPYITFIDTGDTFLNDEVQANIIDTINNNPEIVIFSWQYKINNKISNNTNNRLHGRVYKREFIQQYNISFCPESSYTNEDIGFNRLCRIIVEDKQLKTLDFKEPVIIYEKDINSLTNKNKCEFFYRQQNTGISLVTLHTVKIAKQNNISKIIILNEINSIMCSLYYTFLCTAYERPEFIQEAWNGARIFFNNCFKNCINKESLLVEAYSKYVGRIYSRAKIWKNFKTLNFTQFLKDLNKYNEVPSWYSV